VAGVQKRVLVLGGGLAVVIIGYVFVVAQSSGNRMARLLTLFDPNCDTAGVCYQTQHGLFALGTGGIFGIGLGASREKWQFLPEAHNDFIFAVIGEELGLIGTLMVLGLFAVLGLAMARIVRRHTDPFVKVATSAVSFWVVGQAFVNIGVVIGVLPVIGVPLPLVSAGGSALVTTMAALGMVMSFARSEPGAPEALSVRRSVVRRTLTVFSRQRGDGASGV
jgi:cell division protein FtsW